MEAIEQLANKIDELLQDKQSLKQENQALKDELENERQKNHLVLNKVNEILEKIDTENSS